MVIAQPPLQYLITSSQAGLESFVLSRQGQVANLRREALEVLEEWIESETQLRTARWILECRRAQDPDEVPMEPLELADFDHPSQASFLPPRAMPLFHQPSPSSDSHTRAAVQLNGAVKDGREPVSPALSEEVLSEYPGLSARAEDALNFLEHDLRSQGGAIDAAMSHAVAHTADKSVSAKGEPHLRVGECSTENLSCNSFDSTVVPFSEISLEEENNARVRRKHVAESGPSAPIAVGQAPGPKKPNPVIAIPRHANKRSLLPMRVPFDEIQLRRRVV